MPHCLSIYLLFRVYFLVANLNLQQKLTDSFFRAEATYKPSEHWLITHRTHEAEPRDATKLQIDWI